MNGREKGLIYLAKLKSYFAEGCAFPTSSVDGSVNKEQLAKACGIPRGSLYKNPTIRAALDAELKERGFRSEEKPSTPQEMGPDGRSQEREVDHLSTERALQRKLARAERRLLDQTVEIESLRHELSRLRLCLGREDMIIDSGRRLIGPDEL